jgi:cytochrome c oxidase subunit 3
MSGEVILRTPYVEAEQQRAADFLGMYVFLASEVMLFGGLFAALSLYRAEHPAAAAEAAHHLDLWLGTANTAVLLTSSLFVALAVVFAKGGRKQISAAWLIGAAMLGLAFLAIKGVEYRTEYFEGLMPSAGPLSPLAARPANLFIDLYFVATGLHGIHLTIGVVVLVVAALRQLRATDPTPIVVEITGLYWHLVDVIWLFLFPVLYLARPA